MPGVVEYEPSLSFVRVRGHAWVVGGELAVAAALVVAGLWFGERVLRHHSMVAMAPLWVAWEGFLIWYTVDRLRGGGAWAIRIASGRLSVSTPEEPAGQSIELAELEHVMVADYGRGERRAYLLLRDGRCIELPLELRFPVGRLVKAIVRAAPHVTRVTNRQMPERDPRHTLTPDERRALRHRERDARRARPVGGLVSAAPSAPRATRP